MHSEVWLNLLFLISFSCNSQGNNTALPEAGNKQALLQNTNTTPDSIMAIPLPARDYRRIEADSNSFAQWLRQVHLKKDKTVYLFNGRKKANQEAQFAVLDISTGNQDLQQCADAVMRLRAEYLFACKKFNEIVFTDNAGKAYHFMAPYTYEHFRSYLTTVFGMCGSASLAKQLKSANLKTMQAGDVFIRGGFPGHAEIVMDMATNEKGEKIFLLAQSYMPAQDIHVLVNPVNEKLSPWYKINGKEKIYTPQYVFDSNELRRW